MTAGDVLSEEQIKFVYKVKKKRKKKISQETDTISNISQGQSLV